MQVITPNNVKIYNLSAGKSLPEVSLFYFVKSWPATWPENCVILKNSGFPIEKNVLYSKKTRVSEFWSACLWPWDTIFIPIELRERIELIQDLEMPIVSNQVELSPDGQYIFVTGKLCFFVTIFEFMFKFYTIRIWLWVLISTNSQHQLLFFKFEQLYALIIFRKRRVQTPGQVFWYHSIVNEVREMLRLRMYKVQNYFRGLLESKETSSTACARLMG
jgi:hypothetical protein